MGRSEEELYPASGAIRQTGRITSGGDATRDRDRAPGRPESGGNARGGVVADGGAQQLSRGANRNDEKNAGRMAAAWRRGYGVKQHRLRRHGSLHRLEVSERR